MAITARTNLRGRLGVLIAGSLVVTALTAGTAAASVPTPMGMAAPEPTRLGAAASPSSRPRTPVPGFLLERGRYTRFDAPGAVQQTNALGINNRGVIVASTPTLPASSTASGATPTAGSPPSTSRVRQETR